MQETSTLASSLAGPDRRPGNIGPLIVYLASDAASAVTGQVFGATGWRYSRLTEMLEARSIVSRSGWSVEEVFDIFPATLGEALMAPPFPLDSLEVVSDEDISAVRVEREFSDEGRE
jgi:hypothetical protein